MRKKQATKKAPIRRKAVIEVWKSPKDKKFYFHLRSSNGKVIVDNGQGYERRVSLVKTLKAMVEIFQAGRFSIKES